jgi:hypothetical protein
MKLTNSKVIDSFLSGSTDKDKASTNLTHSGNSLFSYDYMICRWDSGQLLALSVEPGELSQTTATHLGAVLRGARQCSIPVALVPALY